MAAYAINKEVAHPVGARPRCNVHVPFNRHYITGDEQLLIDDALSGTIYTDKCATYLNAVYNMPNILFTRNCTATYELCIDTLGIVAGDEMIVPTYLCAETIALLHSRGILPVYAHCLPGLPGIDERRVAELVTPATKAIVVKHYGGMATDMDTVMEIAAENGLPVIEDAGQGIDAYYKNRALGTTGHMGILCFDEAKNISCGDGAALVLNDTGLATPMLARHTHSLIHGEVTAAYLYAQLLQLQRIQKARMNAWNTYYEELKELELCGMATLPHIPEYAQHNAHTFYLLLKDSATRQALGDYLGKMGISTAGYSITTESGPSHQATAAVMLRLPLYAGISTSEQKTVINKVWRFFLQKP